MKNFKLKLVVLSTLSCLASGQAMADWENLPAAGGSVGSDTSPYILCNPTGNFGSGSGANAPVQPFSTSDKCAVIPIVDILAPDSNFSGVLQYPVTTASTPIVMNNSYTNNTDVNIGTLTEYVWRRSTVTNTYQCIYGMKITLNDHDYDSNQAGQQWFEINDMARKGWSGKSIDVAYSTVPTQASPTYRIGRTFTSVQHANTSNYIDQPLIGLGANPAISSIQNANIDPEWIDFTIQSGYATGAASGMQYIRTECSDTSFTKGAAYIRLRQTSRAGQPPIEVEVTGFIPN